MNDVATWRRLLAEELATWPAEAGAAIVSPTGAWAAAGDTAQVFGWASVTKIVTALTVLRLEDKGVVDLDEPAGPPDSTLRHLLAHASGLACDDDKVMARPGVRRIYSNRGIEVAARFVEVRTGTPFGTLLDAQVLRPLGMSQTQLSGSPARGAVGPVRDLALLAQELLACDQLSSGLVARATTTAFPGLGGVLPGFGRQEPNDWGIGFEIRGRKSPHWTPPQASPSSFGHFGQSGSFLWVDPDLEVACVAAGAAPFGPWAAEAWPRLIGRVLLDAASPRHPLTERFR